MTNIKIITILLLLLLVLTGCAQEQTFGGDVNTISNLLEGKTRKEKSNIKSEEIAKIKFKDKYTKEKTEIEIISVEKIEDGVQIFARAWKDGEQLGFGKDGTVEIERFLIYNPPILVDDKNGNITRDIYDEEGNFIKYRRLREDPEEALKQTLAHTISIVGKEGSNIIAGKVGNTTSTFYPEAGSGGGNTTCDGNSQSPRTNWSSARSAATGSTALTTQTAALVMLALNRLDNNYDILRSFFSFDTSSIDTDDISAADFYFFEDTATQAISNADSSDIDLVASTQANANDVTTADYDQVGTTVFGSISLSSISTQQYNSFSLNSNGLSAINKTGVTKFALRNSRDTDDASPSGRNSVFMFYADETGTTKDPKLVIEHTGVAVAQPIGAGNIMW